MNQTPIHITEIDTFPNIMIKDGFVDNTLIIEQRKETILLSHSDVPMIISALIAWYDSKINSCDEAVN